MARGLERSLPIQRVVPPLTDIYYCATYCIRTGWDLVDYFVDIFVKYYTSLTVGNISLINKRNVYHWDKNLQHVSQLLSIQQYGSNMSTTHEVVAHPIIVSLVSLNNKRQFLLRELHLSISLGLKLSLPTLVCTCTGLCESSMHLMSWMSVPPRMIQSFHVCSMWNLNLSFLFVITPFILLYFLCKQSTKVPTNLSLTSRCARLYLVSYPWWSYYSIQYSSRVVSCITNNEFIISNYKLNTNNKELCN